MEVRFGSFTLNPETRELTRGAEPCHLSTKAFDLLAALVRERPNVLSKTVLQQRLWPDTFVAEANLSNLVGEIRQALDARAAPTGGRPTHTADRIRATCRAARRLRAPESRATGGPAARAARRTHS
jgi:DNA-binding response OmpR family regulator